MSKFFQIIFRLKQTQATIGRLILDLTVTVDKFQTWLLVDNFQMVLFDGRQISDTTICQQFSDTGNHQSTNFRYDFYCQQISDMTTGRQCSAVTICQSTNFRCHYLSTIFRHDYYWSTIFRHDYRTTIFKCDNRSTKFRQK